MLMAKTSSSIPRALQVLDSQPAVRDFLAAALREGRVSHAYLFVGAPGSGKTEAALALAECLVCPQGGDGNCDECDECETCDECDCCDGCDCEDDEYYEIECPSCGEIIYFDDDIDPEDLTCPACHEKIACLVDEDDLSLVEGEDK
jgi:hypothetical protein